MNGTARIQNIVFNLALLGLPIFAFSEGNADIEKDYSRAQELFKSGKEAESLVSLTDFLRRYPDSNLSDDAQFLMGMVYFNQRQYAEALEEFKKVLLFKESDRTPEAAVKLGETWNKMGRSDRARIEWEAVLRRYPKTQAAEEAKVLIAGLKR